MLIQWMRENQLVALGLCILLALVIAAAILSNGLLQMKRMENQNIVVTGAASHLIQSNMATWTVTVSEKGATASEAYQKLQKSIGTVQAYLLQHGLDAKALSTSAIGDGAVYQKDKNGTDLNRVDYYLAAQSITATSSTVNEMDTLAKQVNELLTQGITMESDAPQFFYTKLDDLKIKMLGEATQNARQRAESIANSTGNHIGLIRSASMGVFQITNPYSTDVSDSGISDTASKTKKVTAVVNITFAVQ